MITWLIVLRLSESLWLWSWLGNSAINQVCFNVQLFDLLSFLSLEIDDLYDKKRELSTNFYKELNMYNKQSREISKRNKEEWTKRKEEREHERQLAMYV